MEWIPLVNTGLILGVAVLGWRRMHAMEKRIETLRAEMRDEIKALRDEIKALRELMDERFAYLAAHLVRSGAIEEKAA